MEMGVVTDIEPDDRLARLADLTNSGIQRRVAVGAVGREPVSEFAAFRENTGKFYEFF